MKNKVLVNGNQAVAWGALVANVDFVSHYPGSPVNFVERDLRFLSAKYNPLIKFNDALNEHVAALAAAGASYCGARSLVVMKHVGLNIAADPFNYIGYTGVKGGMVIIVGTDPGANSSTGEEDVHWYVNQFNFPLFEPTSIQDIYRDVISAFELSEKYELPVLIFLPARLCYNNAFIEVPADFQFIKKEFYFEKDKDKYINVGNRAVKNHKKLLEKIDTIASENFIAKRFYNKDAKIGIITRGLAFGHTYESISAMNLDDRVDLLNLDLVFPLSKNNIIEFCKGKTEIIVIEDQDGFMESIIKMELFNEIKAKVYGKEIFPKYGDLQFDSVYNYFSEKFNVAITKSGIETISVPERLGTFCEGCPHTASFYSIDTVLENVDGIIGGDIGCSSLPPFRADWLLCMNAGIGISQGMAQILEKQVVFSTGGDGSFFHAGLISLLSAVQNKIDLIHILFDNRTIAMTGHQKSPSEDTVDMVKLLQSIGVDRIIEAFAYNPNDLTRKLKEEIGKKGVRVFWVTGGCVRIKNDYIEGRRNTLSPSIDSSKCSTCTKCYDELACPAIINEGAFDMKFNIDLDRCMRCGVCYEICPNGAISINSNENEK